MKNAFLVDLGWANIGQPFTLPNKPSDLENEGATHITFEKEGEWVCDPLWTTNERGQLVLHAMFFQSERSQNVLAFHKNRSNRLSKVWNLSQEELEQNPHLALKLGVGDTDRLEKIHAENCAKSRRMRHLFK